MFSALAGVIAYLLVLVGCIKDREVSVKECLASSLMVPDRLAPTYAKTCMEAKGYALLWECTVESNIFIPASEIRLYAEHLLIPKCYVPSNPIIAYWTNTLGYQFETDDNYRLKFPNSHPHS